MITGWFEFDEKLASLYVNDLYSKITVVDDVITQSWNVEKTEFLLDNCPADVLIL